MPIKTVNLNKLIKMYPKPNLNYSLALIPLKLKDGYLSSKKELEIMAHLCRLQNPKNIFEIGTFEGLTTLILAMNSKKNAKIFTLDIPPKIPKSKYKINSMNYKYIKKRGKILFEGTIYQRKIKKLYGDSATFDYAPFRKKMDFVFIDGCYWHYCPICNKTLNINKDSIEKDKKITERLILLGYNVIRIWEHDLV